jgi:hypothetical protein
MPVISATWETEIGQSQFKASLGKKISKPPSQRTNQEWQYTSVIPAMWEVEVRGLQPISKDA